MKKEIKMASSPVVPVIVVPAVIVPSVISSPTRGVAPPNNPDIEIDSITMGCVNKPGCNSQIIYVLPYMKFAQ